MGGEKSTHKHKTLFKLDNQLGGGREVSSEFEIQQLRYHAQYAMHLFAATSAAQVWQ